MKISLATSLGLHVSILVAALFVLPNPSPHEVKPVEAIQVDITNIGDVSKKMAMAKDAEKVVEKAAPKKTETVKKADPKAKVAEEVKKVAKEPKAEPPPPPEPKEKPKKEPPKEAEPKPLDSDPLKALIKETVEEPPPKKKEEPKKAEKKPEKKPEKKKEKLDLDQMEAFLNKIDDESTAPVETSEVDGAPTKGEANLQGTDDQLAATVVDALKKRIQDCWVVPPGAREANISVRLRIMLNPDGTANGTPQVTNSTADPLFGATARSAIAAVMACQTYDFLPQDRYDLWKDFFLTFNPNMMFDS